MPKPDTREGRRVKGWDQAITNEETHHQTQHPQRRVPGFETTEERQHQDGAHS